MQGVLESSDVDGVRGLRALESFQDGGETRKGRWTKMGRIKRERQREGGATWGGLTAVFHVRKSLHLPPFFTSHMTAESAGVWTERFLMLYSRAKLTVTRAHMFAALDFVRCSDRGVCFNASLWGVCTCRLVCKDDIDIAHLERWAHCWWCRSRG